MKRILPSLGGWRVAPIWYLIAIGLPLVLQLASIFINLIFSAQDLD